MTISYFDYLNLFIWEGISFVNVYLKLIQFLLHELVYQVALEHDLGLLLSKVILIAIHISEFAQFFFLGWFHDLWWTIGRRSHKLLINFTLLPFTLLFILQFLSLHLIMLATILQFTFSFIIFVHLFEVVAAKVGLAAF